MYFKMDTSPPDPSTYIKTEVVGDLGAGVLMGVLSRGYEVLASAWISTLRLEMAGRCRRNQAERTNVMGLTTADRVI